MNLHSIMWNYTCYAMKKTLYIILSPILLFIIVIQFNSLSVPNTEFYTDQQVDGFNVDTSDVTVSDKKRPQKLVSMPVYSKNIKTTSRTGYLPSGNTREDLINYAFTLIGSPYVFGGNTQDGFDCSGFTTHVFDQIGISLKRSSGLQATEGIAVDRKNAAPGDLVIFTGTDKNVREPGHVGIVISAPGDTIEFIHSSSSRRESGVKISQVEGSGYDNRFLGIRRIL